MSKVTIDKTKCPQDHVCPSMSICPVNAIKQEGYLAPTIDKDKCIGCMKCVKFCPKGAFKKV